MSEEHHRRNSELRRLVVEGAVIVTSILLAFAVDASWDRYVVQQDLSASLVQLREQLHDNRSEMTRAMEVNRATLDALVRFVEATPARVLSMPVDSLDDIASALARSGIYDQDGGVVEQFVAGGQLVRIRDQQLRAALMNWSTLPEELAEDYARIPVADESLRQIVADHGVFSASWGEPLPPGASGLADVLAKLRMDPLALEFVVYKVFVVETYDSELAIYRDGLFDLLAELLQEP